MSTKEQQLRELFEFVKKTGHKMFILKDRQVVETDNLEEYLNGFGSNKRVRATYAGDSWISTIFLSIDHGHGRPLFFETLVFKGKYAGKMNRYSTYEEAERGHERMVKKVIRNL